VCLRYVDHVSDRWWRGLDATLAGTLPTGARTLDVGCGDGSLVRRLTELGFDALGVDPNAPPGPRLLAARVDEAHGLGEFDAITAVMALHHCALEATIGGIVELLRPGGILLVYDFGWERYDDRAADWLAEQEPADASNSVEAWKREHGDLHTGAAVLDALAERFPSVESRGSPYLARMIDRTDLEVGEQAAIERGGVPAIGLRCVARR
jgi:2-polyprenyl-3-methyl-5-hydroxy-6-metoxy-1,4-benzoquinol methylase